MSAFLKVCNHIFGNTYDQRIPVAQQDLPVPAQAVGSVMLVVFVILLRLGIVMAAWVNAVGWS